MNNPDHKNASTPEEELKLMKEKNNYLGAAGTRFITVPNGVVICRDDMPAIIVPKSDLLNYARKVSGMIFPHETKNEQA